MSTKWVVARAAKLMRAESLKNGDVPGVYAVSDGEFFKVGRAEKSIRERLRNLQCGNPRKLVLVCILSLNPNEERSIHAELERFHVRGEWYAHGDAAAEAVLAIWQRNGCPGGE